MTKSTEHHVYRAFDEVGRLLYVGCTSNPQNRFGCHRSHGSKWLPYAASTAWDTFPTREEALLEEARAIRVEAPRFNVVTSQNVVALPFPDAEPANVHINDLLRGAPGRVETAQDRKRASLQLIRGGAA